MREGEEAGRGGDVGRRPRRVDVRKRKKKTTAVGDGGDRGARAAGAGAPSKQAAPKSTSRLTSSGTTSGWWRRRRRKNYPNNDTIRGGWVLPLVYGLLVALRGWSAVWGSTTGYIHPDEFFQSPEVAAAPIFLSSPLQHNNNNNNCTAVASDNGNGSSAAAHGDRLLIPWEFDPAFACRSIVPPLLISGLPFLTLGYLNRTLSFIFQRQLIDSSRHDLNILSGYSLLVAPRLFVFLLSLLIDVSAFKIARMWGLNNTRIYAVLLTLSSSWVMLLFHTRTFSNTLESIILSLSCLLVVRAMAPHLRPPSLYQDLSLGMLVAAGIFTRFTFLFFFLPMGLAYVLFHSTSGLWPALPFHERNRAGLIIGRIFGLFHHLLIVLLGFLALSLLFILVDSLYFGSLKILVDDDKTLTTLSEAIDLLLHETLAVRKHTVTWVGGLTLTPWNSLRYNLQVENLKEHGIHPRYTHCFIYFPMLYGPLALLASIDLLSVITRSRTSRGESSSSGDSEHQRLSNSPDDDDESLALTLLFMKRSRAALALSIVSGLGILSLAPHQEPRFLVPLLLPLTLSLVPRYPNLRRLSAKDSTLQKIPSRATEKLDLNQQPIKAISKVVQFTKNRERLPTSNNPRRFSMYSSRRTTLVILLVMWISFNASLYIFFGTLHQAGVMSSLLSLSTTTTTTSQQKITINDWPTQLLHSTPGVNANYNTTTHIIYFKTYMPPRFLLIFREDVVIHDAYGDLNALQKILARLHNQLLAGTGVAKILVPASVNLRALLPNIPMQKEKQGFWPHISTEDLPRAWDDCYLAVYNLGSSRGSAK